MWYFCSFALIIELWALNTRQSFSWRWHWRRRRKPLPLLKLKPKQRLWRLRKQCWKVSTATRKRRSRRHPPSGGPKHCSSGGSPNILGRAPQEKHTWPLCHHQIPLHHRVSHEEKTTTHWYSLWMSRPTSTKLNSLWRSSVMLTWLRSILWSGLMERRRHMFDWLLTMMLWMLPTKLGSSKLSPAG